ncbi:hypothetical protein [Martelella endophytica]|nr:hypothetical protein [Martelella endophytica]
MRNAFSKTGRNLAVAGLSALLFGATAALAAGPAIPEGTGITSWAENGEGGIYLLQLYEGGVAANQPPMIGEVLSDSNCSPDEDNINHCENEIRFEDGTTLKGINNHRMAVNRCLRRGEKVFVSHLEDGWVLVSTGAE